MVLRMKDPILQDGDPALRSVARPVAEDEFGGKELITAVERMIEALDKERDGVALAAPQIGIPLRIFVVRHDRLYHTPPDMPQPKPEVGIYINPEVVRTSRRREMVEEGCLSVRRVYGKTLRHDRATVRARLPDGRIFERGGGGILAQAFQHEIEHLDGVLFIDHAVDLIELLPHEAAQHTKPHEQL